LNIQLIQTNEVCTYSLPDHGNSEYVSYVGVDL